MCAYEPFTLQTISGYRETHLPSAHGVNYRPGSLLIRYRLLRWQCRLQTLILLDDSLDLRECLDKLYICHLYQRGVQLGSQIGGQRREGLRGV